MAFDTPIFHLRGDSLTARVSQSGPESHEIYGSTTTTPAVEALVASGCFGSSVINTAHASAVRAMTYPGKSNWSQNAALSVLIRFQYLSSAGTPSTTQSLWCASPGYLVLFCSLFEAWITTAGRIAFFGSNERGSLFINASTSAAKTNWVNGQFYDLMISWDGTTTANSFKVSIDGVEFGTLTPTNPASASRQAVLSIAVATGFNAYVSNIKVNEFAVWNTAENHVYAARSAWIASTAFDGQSYTDPTEANVRGSTGYVMAGVAKTGTLVVPTLANTKTGVAGDGGTGTYDGSDRWTDPGVSDVRSGVAYKANSTTNNRTGTLVQITNVVAESEVNTDDGEAIVTLTQGDVIVLQLRAVDNGAYPNLSTASLATRFRGVDGDVVLLNASHTVDADQVTNAGRFTLALAASDTTEMLLGNSSFVVTITYADTVVSYRGRVNVQSALPV